MALFVVVLDEIEDDVDVDSYDDWDVYEINDHTFLVSTELQSGGIARRFNIPTRKTQGDNSGVVLGLNGKRSGFYDATIWEWFDDNLKG